MGLLESNLHNASEAQRRLTTALEEVDRLRDERDERILDALEAGATRYQLSKRLGMSEGHLARYIPRLSRRAIPDTAPELDTLDAFVKHVVQFPDSDAAVMLDGTALVYRARVREEARNEYGSTEVYGVSRYYARNGIDTVGLLTTGIGEKTEASVRNAIEAVLAGEKRY